MNAEVLERSQARVERYIVLGGSLASHANDLLQFLGRKLCRLTLNAGKRPHCIRYFFKLRPEFGIQSLYTVLYRLVQLLEALIDLRSVIRGHFFVHHDQLVKMTDAAVLLITSLVDTVALGALLLAFGTLIFQVTLEILPGYLHKLACIAGHGLHRTDFQMSLQVTCAHRRAVALIRACQDSQVALIAYMPLIVRQTDVFVVALVDTLKCCPLEHFRHHWVQV